MTAQVAGDGSGSAVWTTLESKKVFSCPVFSVHEKISKGPDGRKGRFSVLDAADWATVVPLVKKERQEYFLMVRQYRQGSETSSLEFPGGVVDSGEKPEQAAARELREETGYTAGSIVHAGTVYPNPALQNNKYHVYLAQDLTPSGAQNLDESEIVDALLVPAEDVFASMGTGEYSHGLMVAALFLAQRARAALKA